MRLFHRKSKFERMIETLESSEVLKSAARKAVESAVSNSTSPKQAAKVNEAIETFDFAKPQKHTGGFGRKAKSGLVVAAGVAAITAASASVSSIRHRESPT
ncbi:MAG: hypothetical protein M3Y23_02165 [Actinomycetota bacterium]|nr:hypothetical protein [Actinomycetota bacterium]